MILDSIGHILPGCLPASFRGVSFFVPDASTEAGRRVAETLFPGVDRAAYDDFGLRPAVVTVDGLMVGDDYVAQARALQAAFERPGPGTLIHPWLGAMSVILEEPGEITFSAAELRVARFSASFKRIRAGLGLSLGDTASLLLSAARSFLAASRGLGAAPALASPNRAASLAVGRTARLVTATWADVAVGQAASAVRAVSPGLDTRDARALSMAVAAVSDCIAGLVAAAAEEPAVSPAAGAPDRSALPAVQAIDLLLAAGNRLVALQDDAPAAVDRVMLIAAAADAIGTAATLSVYVDHPSRQDAQAMRGRLTGALNAVSLSASAIEAAEYAGPAGAVGRPALGLRTAIAADINETIGRLPAVAVVATAVPTDAFLIAGDLYGDRPEMIEAGYRSIVERNRPRHAAQMSGRIEVLK